MNEYSKSAQARDRKLYAAAAREFFKINKVYKYRMKKIEKMTDDEVIEKCHWWYEENNLYNEYFQFEDKFLENERKKSCGKE